MLLIYFISMFLMIPLNYGIKKSSFRNQVTNQGIWFISHLIIFIVISYRLILTRQGSLNFCFKVMSECLFPLLLPWRWIAWTNYHCLTSRIKRALVDYKQIFIVYICKFKSGQRYYLYTARERIKEAISANWWAILIRLIIRYLEIKNELPLL